MANNNTNNTNNTETFKDLKKALQEGVDLETMKGKIELDFRDRHDDVISCLSNEELEQIISNACEYVTLTPMAEYTAERVADKVLFNVTDSRWLADKAVDILTTALGVGGVIWAGKKAGVFLSEQNQPAQSSLVGSVEDMSNSHPFADVSPVEDSVARGMGRPALNGFDQQAS